MSNLDVSHEDSEAIIKGIASGLLEEQTNAEIRLTTLKALQDALPLFEKRLEEERLRDFLLTIVIKACDHQNEEIVLKAVQCLSDMFKSCYRYLTNRHLEVIAERTLPLLKNSRLPIMIGITEFWTRIAKYEEKLERLAKIDSNVVIHYFTKNFSVALTKEFLLNLMKRDNEDIEAGLSLHGATLDCITRINHMAQEETKALNMEFIESMISSDQERNKVAALLCFEAMILGYQFSVAELISSSFKMVLGLITVNSTLCKAALKVIKAAALKYPEILLKDDRCVEWLEVLMQLTQHDSNLGKLVCEVISSKIVT